MVSTVFAAQTMTCILRPLSGYFTRLSGVSTVNGAGLRTVDHLCSYSQASYASSFSSSPSQPGHVGVIPKYQSCEATCQGQCVGQLEHRARMVVMGQSAASRSGCSLLMYPIGSTSPLSQVGREPLVLLRSKVRPPPFGVVGQVRCSVCVLRLPCDDFECVFPRSRSPCTRQ